MSLKFVVLCRATAHALDKNERPETTLQVLYMPPLTGEKPKSGRARSCWEPQPNRKSGSLCPTPPRDCIQSFLNSARIWCLTARIHLWLQPVRRGTIARARRPFLTSNLGNVRGSSWSPVQGVPVTRVSASPRYQQCFIHVFSSVYGWRSGCLTFRPQIR